jgi:nucleoid DNA-binding protein
MTQSQIMEHFAKTIGISKKDAKRALDELNTLVVRELKKEESIRLAACIARFATYSQSLGATPCCSKP